MAENSPRGPRPEPQSIELTRRQREVFDAIVDAPQGVTIVELAERLDCHPNTVREHIEALTAYHFVRTERRPCQGRGRPAQVFHAVAARRSMTTKLLQGIVVAAVGDDLAAARALGLQWAEESFATPAVSSEEAARKVLGETLRNVGFAPTDIDGALHLYQCPFMERSGELNPLMCAVHAGLVDGIIAKAGGEFEGELTPFYDENSCRVRVEGKGRLAG